MMLEWNERAQKALQYALATMGQAKLFYFKPQLDWSTPELNCLLTQKKDVFWEDTKIQESLTRRFLYFRNETLRPLPNDARVKWTGTKKLYNIIAQEIAKQMVSIFQ